MAPSFWVISRSDNARWGPSVAHYQAARFAAIMRSGSRVLPIIRTAWRCDHHASCELVPAVPSPLHANPTGTTGPARILRVLPRLLPSQPIHHLSRSKCEGLLPPLPRSFSLLPIPPHLYDPRTTIRIERSCFLKEKQSSACLIGISNWRYRLFILSFINFYEQMNREPVKWLT